MCPAGSPGRLAAAGTKMALITLVTDVMTTGTRFHGSGRMKIRTVRIKQGPAKYMVGSFTVAVVTGFRICIKFSFMGVTGVANSGIGLKFHMAILPMNPFRPRGNLTSIR